MQNYFIHPKIGKIVIIYDYNKDIKEFYIEENEILFEPSSQELTEIQKLFTKSNEEIWNSELTTKLIENNPQISDKDYVAFIIDHIEKIIEEKYKVNLYRNLRTLEIDFHSKNNTPENLYAGEYDEVENKIEIYESFIRKIWELIPENQKSEETYNKMLLCSIIHELLHMASREYDEENQTIKCGFNSRPYTKESDINKGLTEGFTEIIAYQMSGNPYELMSNYMPQALLANQLLFIIGDDIMIDSYFGNLGIEPLEEELQKLIPNQELSYDLFRNIEDSYLLRNANMKSTFLAQAQTTLISYFFRKISNLIEEGNMEFSEIINNINRFEKLLITEEKLKLNSRDPKLYPFINESVTYFYNQKETYLSIMKTV